MRFILFPMSMLMLAGCHYYSNAEVAASNDIGRRCYQPISVNSGKTLEDRANLMSRVLAERGICDNSSSYADSTPSTSVVTYGFPVGFYPQGQDFRNDPTTVQLKSYDKDFKKNLTDYQATIDSKIPVKCIGNGFYGCVNRISQTFTVTTNIMGDYINKPGCVGNFCTDFSSVRITVRPPMTFYANDSYMDVSLTSKSRVLTVNSASIDFNSHQAAKLLGSSTQEDLYDSYIYEVFIALDDNCKKVAKETFYKTLLPMFTGKQTYDSRLDADGFRVTAMQMQTSKRIKICGMSAQLNSTSAQIVDFDGAGRYGIARMDIQ